MLSLRIEYLTGRCVATSYNDRQTAEWPPHPARVFSALVAAWAEDDQREDERAALDWLASLDPPAISASRVSRRKVVTHFVPVNDTSVLRTFETQVARIAEQERLLREATVSLANAEDDRDEKAATRLKKQLAKLTAEVEKQRAKLREQQVRDQESLDDSASAREQAARLIPEGRLRQARAFPSVTPEVPVVHFTWATAPTEGARKSLEAIARRVARVGHSSSLVSCTFVDTAPPPALVPREDGDEVFRVPATGQVDRLVEAHARHREIEPRVMPGRFQRYGMRVEERRSPRQSVFTDEWIVLRQVGGARMSSTVAVEISQAVRAALMSHAVEPLPELLTGHRSNGEPSQTPHVAIVPLPFVGSLHATGLILGVALALPWATRVEDRLGVLQALGAWEEESRRILDDDSIEAPPLQLRLGARGIIELERVVWGLAPLATLRPQTWCRASRQWLSVTPVALDRNPGNLFSGDARAAEEAYAEATSGIAQSCTRVGLPPPVRVEILPSVTMAGVSKARSFAPFPADARKTQRVKLHAFVEFEERVAGPLLVGAGRYHGLGFFRPIDERDDG